VRNSRVCDALKPCRDIHAIPEDVMRLDDYVADIDAHSESNAPVFQITDRKTVDASLELPTTCARPGLAAPAP
jgi:hypothetical protein